MMGSVYRGLSTTGWPDRRRPAFNDGAAVRAVSARDRAPNVASPETL